MKCLLRFSRRIGLFGAVMLCCAVLMSAAAAQAQGYFSGSASAWTDANGVKPSTERKTSSRVRWSPSRHARASAAERAKKAKVPPPHNISHATAAAPRNSRSTSNSSARTVSRNPVKRALAQARSAAARARRAAPSQYASTRATSTTRRSTQPQNYASSATRNQRRANTSAARAQYVVPAQGEGSGYREPYGRPPRQAQRGYAAPPPSRHIHSSSRARSYYQDGPSFRAPEELGPGIPEPDFNYENEYFGYEGEYYGGGEGPYGSCNECSSPYPYHAQSCGSYCHWWWLENLTVFGGTHAFKGPVDDGVNGNFGLGVGVNWGGPLWQAYSIGYQVGWQTVFSNFDGDQVLGPVRADDRSQHFITAGIFHRPLYNPVQWGVVFDWMRDEYYIEQSMSQVRVEVSLLGPYQNEIGMWGAASTGDDTAILQPPVVAATQIHESEPADLFAFFFRRRFATGIEGRVWGGFTGRSDGLFGADMRAPISPDFAIQGGFTYLAPHEESAAGGQREESWGLIMNMVWYPGGSAAQATRSPWRPLMNVADNSVFMVDHTVR